MCPQCGKRGVWLRLGADDCWVCRYCGWYTYSGGYDDADRQPRKDLSAANPSETFWWEGER